ncbi:MAG TPA: hypothetical protein VF460_08700 [Burkholderiales bacterium]
MKQARQLPALILCAGFVAATLQGSRLPEEPVSSGQQTVQVPDTAGNRPGSGSDKEEYPPRSEGVLA